MKFACILFFPVTLLFFASCQKPPDVNLDPPPPDDSTTVPHTVDSTKLVKSILYISYIDPMGSPDSILETYNYDTLQHSITLTWTSRSRFYLNNVSAVFKYNQRNYLTKVTYHYPAGFPPDPVPSTINITYDNTDILNSMTMTTLEDSVYAVHFLKSDTASGYTLSWTDGTYGLQKARFDSAGRCMIRRFEYLGDTLPGVLHVVDYDSISYDAEGNVSSINAHWLDPLSNTMMQRLLFEFTFRELVGDELYNQRQVLLRGVANLPDNGSQFYSRLFGCLSYCDDYGTSFQYYKYPLQTAKAYNYYVLNTYRNYLAHNEFDSLDRVTVFTGFKNDETLSKTTYKVTYYK